jgi:type II secretory ATPase GspE/PulE/Tfp pilus assembly ATPase PilB-like protein
VEEDLERAIAEGAQTDAVRHLALKAGMIDMKSVGLLHVASGTTSLEEILRVVA